MADTFLHPDGKITAKKDTNLKVRIDFDELRFKIDGEKVNVWAYAISCDAYAYERKETKEKAEIPGKVFISLSKGTDKPGQSAIIHALTQLDPAKTYSGFIAIDDSVPLYGKAVTNAAMWEGVKDELIQVMDVEKPEKLTEADLKAPKSTRSSSSQGVEPAYEIAMGRAKAATELMVNPEFLETAAACNAEPYALLKVILATK